MRLKRLMSIVLAVALVMSFAMSASAGKLYYELDFADYAENVSSMGNHIAADSNALYDDTDRTYDVTAWRTGGTKMIASKGPNISNPSYGATISQNGLGNYQFTLNATQFGTGINNLTFVADESWDATNTNETFVISLDLDPKKINYWSDLLDIVGKRGTDYRRGRILTRINADPARIYAVTTKKADGGDNLDFAVNGATQRVAIGLKYNAADAILERDVAVDGVIKTTTKRSTLTADAGGLDGMTTIEAVGVDIREKNSPGYGLIRMYSIDTAEGFKVTADIDEEKRVDVGTSSATITFTHPVAAFADDAVYTLKKGTATIGTLDATDIVTGTVGGKYVSTATVTLPTLEMSSDYEIVVSGVKNELGSELADNTISFSTPKPDITMTAPTITGATVGNMSEASVAISNNTDSTPKAVSVIYAVYTTAGQLVDVVYANDTIAAGTTATISAGITLGSDVARAKVMVWDGATAVSPLRGFYGVNVTSAQ